ncbi:MAG: Zn-ribbon domain-containing OB-fold protein [Gammaproteobacteria bacterium]|nr:Zn-ribbon domain-containing OB-fold protein [Gammaproteobacteria bacterium]
MSDGASPAKPLPPVDPGSHAYWEACNSGRLLLQRCAACGHRQHYHRVVCTVCGAGTLEDLPASGRGTVRSFTVIRRAVSAAFETDVPYVVALIELAEGPTMMSNIIGSSHEQVAIGSPVELDFERRSETINIPQFRLLE